MATADSIPGRSAWRAVARLLLLCLLSSFPLVAQGQRYHFKTYTIDDGLAQSQPKALLQDRQGYLWIGTNGGGVNRFDGRRFATYTTEDGLASNEILAIFEDRKGNLWFGTSGGVSVYDHVRFRSGFAGVEGEPVNALVEDRAGVLWLGTARRGLARYDGASTRFVTAGGAPAPVQALLLDASGTLWAGTGRGLCRLVGEALACFTDRDGLPDDAVNALAQDDRGRLWVGTARGAVTYDGRAFTAVPALAGADVTSIMKDRSGALWLGTRGGVVQVRGDTPTVFTRANGLGHDIILSIYEDREGNVWIGDDGAGLNRFTRTPFALFDTAHGLGDNTVWTTVEDAAGHYWFGTNGRGLSHYDGHAFTSFTTRDGLASDVVYASLRDRDGQLWFGTRQGAYRYDGRRFSPVPGMVYRGAIYALLEDRDGHLWFGTATAGALRYDGRAFTAFTTADGLAGDAVLSMHEDPEGHLWFGTRTGLSRYDGTRFESYTEEDGLGRGPVSAIVTIPGSGLWTGTYGGGLSRYVPGAGAARGSFRSWTVADGLSDNNVLSTVLDDAGDLWICTNNGLNKLDVDRLKRAGQVVFRTYGRNDGFEGTECNSGAAYRDSRGRLWFGTVKGVERYAPEDEVPATGEPLTHITGARLFFEAVDWSRYTGGTPHGAGLPPDLRLPHEQNHVTFEFTGIHLRAPEKVRYQYQLEGLDRSWSPPTAENQVTYANLPPGRYTFKVKASSGDGGWDVAPATYRFSIAPPFWQAWWFLLGSALTIVLSVYGGFSVREEKSRRQRQVLEQKVAERTKELLEEKEKVIRFNEKLAETNLELEKLSLVVRKTDNAVFITDPQGRIEWVNEGFTRTTGYTLERLIQEKGATLVEVSSNPGIAAALEGAIEHQRSIVYESTFTSLRGEERWLSSTLTPVIGADGTVRKLVVIDTDITDRKALEGELIRAREAALAAADAKSVFLANMSHEIRTPMNGVIGMTNLLLGTPLSEEQRDFVQTIHTSGEALLTIINDILDFSKIEAGQIELEEHPFDLRRCVEEALDLMALPAAQKGLELLLDLAPGVPSHVVGDPVRLRQILVNLLGNAVKFTERGEVVLAVAGVEADEARCRLHFAVRDTGIGIPGARMDRLFQPFSQVDASTTRRFGGTGLGLAISRRFCLAMGGTIWAESREGEGSTFHFTIETRPVPEPSREPPGPSPEGLAGYRVLVVDDNETSRRLLSAQAEAWGMRVVAAGGASEALARVAAPGEAFDVALVDQPLLDGDGASLAGTLAVRRPALPVVLLGSVHQPAPSGPSPFAACLNKPVRQGVLLAVLKQVLTAPAHGDGAAGSRPGEVPSLPPDTPARALPRAEARSALRVLLAEDNVINQKVALRMLERLGYRADVATSGLDVLEAVHRQPYDVVLMDLQMPGMDGLEATQRLRRELPAARQPRVVAMTANVMQGDRERCLEAGMDDYIAKPVKLEALAEVLGRVEPVAAA